MNRDMRWIAGFSRHRGLVAVAMITAALLAACPPADVAGAEGVSFALPEPIKISEKTIAGRTAIRYEHGSVAQWGYTKPQRDYFNLVLPAKPGKGMPLRVVLHSAGHSGDSAMTGGLKNHTWIHYYGDEGFTVLYLDCRRNARDNDWWWGYHKIRKTPAAYRAKLCPTEKRVLSTIEWVIREYSIDRNRVYLSGISMGGSGTLGLGMCRGDVFAAAAVAVPAGIEHGMIRMAGGKHPDPPVLVNCSSHIDGWSKGQAKLLAYCRKNKYPVVFAWGLFGHTNNVSGANRAVFEFPWTSIRKNEAYPVFANASTDNRYPGHKNKTDPDQAGQLNGYFRWRNVTDTPGAFVMELRLVKRNELTQPIETPREAVADITFRRLQRFRIAKAKTYRWQMLADGKVVQSGRAQADAAGLLTLPKVKVTDLPAQLRIAPD